jgi:phosphatidylglycerol---prolipoprotein diacylglyceryl transferase
MIDPIIFSFKLFAWQVTLRWYGVLVMLGAVVGAWFAEKEIRRRGENGESIWDAMIWVLPIGIIGARLWYVANSILGGSTYYTDDPIKILYITEGGLHFFGGLLFGVITLYIFLKNNGYDHWLFLDAIAPATLLGQALARPANYINQELYGQPTQLPWGIPIETSHRLSQFADLPASTRFHPTFAYEMILNLLIVLFLWWLSRRYEEDLKPGALFSIWLILAGLSRTTIEFFRPDQPRIGDSFISYTMLVAFGMAVLGAVMLLARYGKLQLAAAEDWEEEYQIKKVEKKQRPPQRATSTTINQKVTSKRSANAVSPSSRKRTVTRKTPAKKVAKKPTSTRKTKTSKK